MIKEERFLVWFTVFLGVFLGGLNFTHAYPPCILFGNHFLGWGSTLSGHFPSCMQDEHARMKKSHPISWTI